MNEQPVEKSHLSYSQIAMYLACSLRYQFHYVQRLEPAFVGSSLAFGHCVHGAANALYQSVLEGDPLTAAQVHDVFRQEWESDNRNRTIKFCNGDTLSSLSEKARRMLEVLHKSIDPTVQLVGLEEPFEVDLGKRVPPLVGVIDVVELNPEGTITVVDLKTASRRYSEQSVHTNLQLTCYSLGAGALGFNGETRFRLDVLLKTKESELVRYETARTDADRTRFVRLVKSVWQGIRKEVFYPKQDWHCVQCPHQEPCQDW
jgi:putative RecB family exonuclease